MEARPRNMVLDKRQTNNIMKNRNAVSRMKRVVSGTHWNFDPSWDWLSPLNAPAFERMPRSDWEWRNKCRLIF